MLSSFGHDIKYKDYPLSNLTVNHIGGEKLVNNLLDLEWMSDIENGKEMAIRLNLSKPLKITLTKNVYQYPKGTTFFLEKRSDVELYGGSRKNLGHYIKKSIVYRGCIFIDVDEKELLGKTLGMPKEIGDFLFRHRSAESPPLKVTCIVDIGKYKKGDVFYFLRRDKFKKSVFNYRGIRAVIQGKEKSLYGCLWENTTIEELRKNINEEESEKFFDIIYGVKTCT